MLRLATDMLASKGHISTQYPPQWMPSPTLVDKLPRVVWTLFCIMFNALFTWLSIIAKSRSTIATLTAIYPLNIIATALWFCFGFPLEYVEKLNFRAVQILVLGAFFNLVFGENNFLTHALMSEKVGSFVGTSILSLGTIVVSLLIVDLLSAFTFTVHVSYLPILYAYAYDHDTSLHTIVLILYVYLRSMGIYDWKSSSLNRSFDSSLCCLHDAI